MLRLLSIASEPRAYPVLDRRRRTFTPVYRGSGFRIAFWNVDSLRVKLKSPQRLVTFITEERPSVMFIQESKLAAQ